MWGYLSEFWSAITEVGGYTIDWFQSLGNAVAGALGGAFDWVLHILWDSYTFLRWVLDGFAQLFVFFTQPLNFFYQFLKAFWLNAIKSPSEISSGLTQYATSSASVFQAIPYWDTIQIVLGVGVLVAGGFGLIALLLKIR